MHFFIYTGRSMKLLIFYLGYNFRTTFIEQIMKIRNKSINLGIYFDNRIHI